ncbi:T9SS type A sorting domain-containing protein [Tamlana haliotis]|uniref:T9SS type A sorting domain-containing protein n=1 Tax=Pseudotamlana haliotis TaxID=2614804 RepID=A0A6N6MCG9_9FLAO|nr:T9SS type A sorting domain-containing protein [Tamlana haliotis]KAB1067386.1 T9SS type A sorting domain-containing protein [Tamlana haliotis]
MNDIKLLTAISFCFIFNLGFSQTGPGGVGTNDGSSDLVMWYRTDNGIISTGTDVGGWENSAGYTEHDMSQDGATMPQLISSSLNGYDEIEFDNNGILQTGKNLLEPNNFVTTDASSFTFLKTNNTTRSRPYGTLPKSTSQRYASHIAWNDGTVYFDTGDISSPARMQLSQTGYDSYSSWNFNSNSSTGRQLYRNGDLIGNLADCSTYNAHSSQWFALGKDFDGNMTEFILFNKKINAAERIIINNYLSAKYDTALSATANDYYTQDDNANGDFDHNVAGIGQASDGSNHTDSQGTGIVRINNPSNLNNDMFLFWGEETKDPTYDFSVNTTNYTEQLNSKWRVSKRGSIDDLTVTFNLDEIILTGGAVTSSCPDLELIVSNDSNFLPSNTTTYSLTNDTVNNTATANSVNFTDSDYFTIRYANQIVWDGSSFTGGSGAGGAPSSADSCLKFLVLSGTATLTEDAHVREIEVLSGATLAVNDGFLLETENRIILNGTLNLLGEAQLIQNHTGPDVNLGSGQFTIRQQGTTNFYNYNYWCSPVNTNSTTKTWQIDELEDTSGPISFTTNLNADPSTSPITLSSRWLYEFNGTTDNYYDWNKISEDIPLNMADGFTLKGSGASGTEQEYIFRGMPNNGDHTAIAFSGNDFLTGNPYPSAIDADLFIADNSSVIDGTLYFWEHFDTNNSHYLKDYEGGYATYNLMMGTPAVSTATEAQPDNSGLTSGVGSATKPAPTKYISVGQGFFVTIISNGGIEFNNGQRAFARDSDGGSIFYKTASNKSQLNSDERTKLWFSFTEPQNGTKILGLGYDPTNATYHYDNGYDAITFDEFKNDAYWVLNDKKLVIQALPSINLEDQLTLTVKATDAGIYKFAIDDSQNVPDDLDIYLKDDLTERYYDIKSSTAEISLSSGLYENRFSIVFQDAQTLSNEDEAFNSISVSYDKTNKTLTLNRITDLKSIKSLKIYDTMGKSLLSVKSLESNTIDLSSFSDGIYVLSLKTTDHASEKSIKFIKY